MPGSFGQRTSASSRQIDSYQTGSTIFKSIDDITPIESAFFAQRIIRNQAAKNLEADALEQLGYQAGSEPWRNFYLTGAQELRKGLAKRATPKTVSQDTVRAMSVEMFLDYLGVRLNAEKADNAKDLINVDLSNDGTYFLELENGC
ncbi:MULTISPECIES: alkyl sulfatase dimerization domain-containing protein [unclassified Chelatococcus]|uniref:alkyl sulfatase dimerization domain-containing protein n=1 Tax=unclassified Chelatococcus TaxID=2638111 RepID=UPI0025BAC3ED|nr:alkyl sulfatase dimerization domain-containing protein [Chelatococcus sp.]